MVYVLSRNKQPLMPTENHAMVRVLLKEKKAKVVKRTPFTIQLLVDTKNYKQPITLGVDAGSKKVGLSATTETKELFASEVTLRTDIVDNIKTRRDCRKSRRNRKTRYRKPRFKNRKREKGWLAPSVEHKIHTHLKVVADVHKILPISKVVIEVASFDVQKLKNPEISGKEYQQGEQLGFWNVRAYVLHRDEHKCKCCNGESGDKILNVHHIIPKKKGGSDAPSNLITLCETCHDDFHDGKITLPNSIQSGESFKDAAFMNTARWKLYNMLKETYPNVNVAFGYITKDTRIRNKLPKSHVVDARCISGHPLAKPAKNIFYQKAMRTRNRQIHKVKPIKGGKRKNNQSPKYVFGYQLYDKILYNGKECFIYGRRNKGSFKIGKLDGTIISDGKSYKKLKPLEKRKTVIIERREAISPPHS